MKPFHRRGPRPSWAAEVVELGAVFLAVGLAHLFVSLVGHHADGGLMLLISGAALLAGMALHRWHGSRQHGASVRELAAHDLIAVPAADRDLLRVRTTLPDRPGALAALGAELAARDVNILAIGVHPAVDGAVDDLLLAVPRGVGAEAVAAAVTAGGGTRTHTAPADAHDLVDPATRALTIAAQAVRDPRRLRPALRHLLSADAVSDRPSPGAAEIRATGRSLYVSRPAMPFTPTELSRARALVDLAQAGSGAGAAAGAGAIGAGPRSTGRGAPNR